MFKRLGIALICSFSFLFWSCGSAPKKEASLQQLIREGRYLEAKERFTSKYDINEIDEDGNTPLHIAAATNNDDIVLFLLVKGADPNLKNYQSQTPLHLAVLSGSTESARHLVSFGANLFARDADSVTPMEAGFARDPVYYDIFITTKTGELRDADTGRTIVHYFAETRNEKAIQSCVRKGIPISVKDNDGKTPLDTAFDTIKGGTAEIAALLILSGAEPVSGAYEYFQTAVTNRNLNYRFDDGQTPLHIASIQGHNEIVRYLLDNNAFTNVQDSSGSSPLHEAVRYGRIEIVKMLLDSGADVNAKDNIGKTPVLLVLPENKRAEIYSLLTSYKADVLLKDMYGDTVLHTATLTEVSPDILEMLVSSGADINARNKDGVTPLALSIENNVHSHVKFYAEKGADINSKDTHGRSPLIMALESNDTTLETILSKKNIDSHDSEGNTPLIVAILSDAKLQKIQYILSLTDDVNARNAEGNTALYLAVIKNRQKLGELLLAKDADIFAANNKSRSPLSLALHSDSSVIDWLITSRTIKATDGSGNSALHYAAEWSLKSAIHMLIAKGASPEAKNANGETPMFNAAKNDNAEIIEQLYKNGCKVNVRDNLGSTPLHTAIRWMNKNSAEKLIMLGADINAQNVSGKSPLAEAVLAGKTDLAKLLLYNGANVNTSDTSGRTILMDAIVGKNINTIKLLLAYNANPQIQEINGRNAYHEAALSGSIEIIDVIRNAGGNPLSRDKNGNTPFSLALKDSDAVMQAVLGTDKKISDSDGNTPIHIIVSGKGSIAMLSKLVHSGYPFDTRNADGYTPLTIAVESNSAAEAKLLLESGANPFIMIDKKGKNAASIALEKKNMTILASIVKNAGKTSDIQGNTILHYAARTADAGTIKKLLSYGLDTNVKNISGETPHMIAIRWKHADSAELLIPKPMDAVK